MSKFEIADKATAVESDVQPAAFLSEIQEHRHLLRMAGGKDQPAAPVETASPDSPGAVSEKTPAAKVMDETMTAAQKELAERRTKNGSISPEDLQEILPKYFPKMKEAISLSDAMASGARKEAEAEYKIFKPFVDQFERDLPAASKRTEAAAAKIPDSDREKVNPLVMELVDEKTTDKRKEEIRTDLAKYPDLVESVEGMNKLLTEFAAKSTKLENAVQTMQNSLQESLVIRGMYKASLEAGFGDRAELERVEKEAAVVQQLFKQAITDPRPLFVDPADLQPKKPLPKTWTI